MLLEKSYIIGVSATAIALALAVFPVFLPGSVAYSPEVALLTATLIAVIWYTALTYELVTHEKIRDREARKSRRRAIATAALTELRTLESILRQAYIDPKTPRAEDIVHPVFDVAIRNLELFDPPTSRELARFSSNVRSLIVLMNALRSALPDQRETLIQIIPYMSYYAIAVIPTLAEALVAQGGEMPQKADAPVFTFDPRAKPPLPESPFGEWDAIMGFYRPTGGR